MEKEGGKPMEPCDVRVLQHRADSEKDKYSVVLKGGTAAVDIEVKISAGTADLLDAWPLDTGFSVSIGPGQQKTLTGKK
jgi:hypothetical protein